MFYRKKALCALATLACIQSGHVFAAVAAPTMPFSNLADPYYGYADFDDVSIVASPVYVGNAPTAIYSLSVNVFQSNPLGTLQVCHPAPSLGSAPIAVR